MEECFFLSASPFALSYIDDDGEEFTIQNERDLTEAILYFVSGDEEANLSIYSGHSANRMGGIGPSTQKISIRIEVILEYDGPSLSDTSSLSSFRTGPFEEDRASHRSSEHSSWRSSGYSESLRSARSRQSSWEEENVDLHSVGDGRRSSRIGISRRPDVSDALETMTLSTSPELDALDHAPVTSQNRPSRRSSRRSQASSFLTSSRRSSTQTAQPGTLQPLTGPESDPAPSLLTHSELGSRWLREQNKLATTRRMIYPRPGSSRRYDSEEESLGSDEESLGDLALVRDARGSEL